MTDEAAEKTVKQLDRIAAETERIAEIAAIEARGGRRGVARPRPRVPGPHPPAPPLTPTGVSLHHPPQTRRASVSARAENAMGGPIRWPFGSRAV